MKNLGGGAGPRSLGVVSVSDPRNMPLLADVITAYFVALRQTV